MSLDLLQKRVIITNWYPSLPFEEGTILYERELSGKKWYGLDNPDDYIYAPDVERAKANFQKLMWWEFREESQLPKYLSAISKEGEFVFEIESYEEYYVGDSEVKHWSYLFKGKNILGQEIEVLAIFTNPATEDDYNQYMNQK